MTKSLKQIQEENRKFILEAIHGCSYEEALKKELGNGCKVKIKRFISNQYFYEEIFIIDNYCDFSTENLFRTIGSFRHNEITEIIGKPLTLSRVLLALPKINKENKTLDFLIGERGWEEIGGKWFDGYKKCFIARVETIFSCDCCEDFWSDVFVWNLELETLEEQSEEIQRKINELFTN